MWPRVFITAVLAAVLAVSSGAAAQDAKAVRHVVVLSFDGLRADALRAAMPDALLERAAFTWRAKTTLPSLTLPSHTSMFTGVPPAVHRMLANDWNTSQEYVKLPTAFSVVTDSGGRSAMFVTKSKLLYLARPGTVARAEFLVYPRYDQTAAVREGMRYLASAQPHLLFIHMADPDDVGHRDGWMSEPYLAVVRQVPATIRLVLDTLERMRALEHSLVIVTSDHGGHGRTHGSDSPEDVTIPWLAFGAVEPGPIRESVMIFVRGPVMIYDTAATAVSALGHAIPAGWMGKPVVKTVTTKR